jgi:hypothetical protein
MPARGSESRVSSVHRHFYNKQILADANHGPVWLERRNCPQILHLQRGVHLGHELAEHGAMGNCLALQTARPLLSPGTGRVQCPDLGLEEADDGQPHGIGGTDP